MNGVERHRTDDIEVGCQIWSRTYQDSAGQQGGIVVAIEDPFDGPVEYTVIRHVSEATGVQTFVIPEPDVIPDATTFFTKNTRIAAEGLLQYASKGSKQRNATSRTQWLQTAVMLSNIADAASLTPRAEQRRKANEVRS